MKKRTHKLFIRKILDRKEWRGKLGEPCMILKTIWEEVPEASLGSYKIPNKDILEFQFVPIDEVKSWKRTWR